MSNEVFIIVTTMVPGILHNIGYYYIIIECGIPDFYFPSTSQIMKVYIFKYP